MLRLNFRPPKKNLNRKTREFAELFEIYLLKAIRSMSLDVGCRSCVIRTTFQSEIVYELFEAQNADFLRIMSLKNIYEILTKKCVHWFSKNLSSGCISASPLCNMIGSFFPPSNSCIKTLPSSPTELSASFEKNCNGGKKDKLVCLFHRPSSNFYTIGGGA